MSKVKFKAFWVTALLVMAFDAGPATAGDDNRRQDDGSERWKIRPQIVFTTSTVDRVESKITVDHFIGYTRYQEELDLASGSGWGVDVEFSHSERFGLGFGVAYGTLDAGYEYLITYSNGRELTTNSGMVVDSLDFRIFNFGPVFHLTRNDRIDWIAQPYIGWASVDENEFVDMAFIGKIEAGKDVGIGVMSGVDIRLDEESRWGLHFGVKWLSVTVESERYDISIDPVTVAAGMYYQF